MPPLTAEAKFRLPVRKKFHVSLDKLCVAVSEKFKEPASTLNVKFGLLLGVSTPENTLTPDTLRMMAPVCSVSGSATVMPPSISKVPKLLTVVFPAAKLEPNALALETRSVAPASINVGPVYVLAPEKT